MAKEEDWEESNWKDFSEMSVSSAKDIPNIAELLKFLHL